MPNLTGLDYMNKKTLRALARNYATSASDHTLIVTPATLVAAIKAK